MYAKLGDKAFDELMFRKEEEAKYEKLVDKFVQAVREFDKFRFNKKAARKVQSTFDNMISDVSVWEEL